MQQQQQGQMPMHEQAYGQTPHAYQMQDGTAVISLEQQQQIAAQQQQMIGMQQQMYSECQSAVSGNRPQEGPYDDVGGELPKEGEEELHLTVDDFDKVTERTYFVKIKGSLRQFARGQVKPIWAAHDGQTHIFQRIAGVDGRKVLYEGDTAKGIILGAHIEAVKNTTPTDIGVNATQIHGGVYTDTGANYAYIIPAKTMQWVKVDKCIFKPKSIISRSALEAYNDTSPEKLETHVFRHAGKAFSLVANRSPLAQMLRLNKEKLKLKFQLGPDDEGYLKVPNIIVDACMKRYEANQRVNFINFNGFQFEFERVDSPTDWARPEGIVDNIKGHAKAGTTHIATRRLENEYEVVLAVNMRLVLYGNEKKSA